MRQARKAMREEERHEKDARGFSEESTRNMQEIWGNNAIIRGCTGWQSWEDIVDHPSVIKDRSYTGFTKGGSNGGLSGIYFPKIQGGSEY